jgi:hypothetical protein
LHVPDVVIVVGFIVGFLLSMIGWRRSFIDGRWRRRRRRRRWLLFIFIVIDGMIGLDIDPVGWMALTSASILVNAENGGQTNGHQIG